MQIYTELTNEEIDKALETAMLGDLRERVRALWGLFKDMVGDSQFEITKRKIKQGYNIIFDIRKIIDGEYEIYPDSNRVKIRGYIQKCDEDDFKDEVELREKKMKDILRQQYDNGNQGDINIDGHEV